MPNSLDYEYHPFSDILTREDFNDIVKQFSKYKDDKKDIPFMVGQMLAIFDKIKFDDFLLSGISLVLITSIIELLTLKIEHIPFDRWYKRNPELVDSLNCIDSWKEYNKIHGAAKRFRAFFHSLNINTKISLLTKIRRENKSGIFTPFCYINNERCIHGTVYCNGVYDINSCDAYTDDEKLYSGMNKIGNYLYNIRSKFVHESKIPVFSNIEEAYNMLNETDDVRIRAGYLYDASFTFWLNEDGKMIRYESNLKVEELYEVLKSNLKRLFCEYLSEV